MREIKFRGFSKALDKWLHGCLINNLWYKVVDGSSTCEIITTELEEISCWQDIDNIAGLEVVSESVGQLTGLKDKNGVDIYEGDIIKDSDMTYTVHFGIFNNEEWTFTGWLLRHKNERISDFGMSQLDADVSEVIGNIYEHPELIK